MTMEQTTAALYQQFWDKARENLGSATAVMIVLGYPHKDPKGRNCASQHFFTNAQRGSKPKDKARQELLKALAGPHGRTIAKAVCLKWGLKIKGITD